MMYKTTATLATLLVASASQTRAFTLSFRDTQDCSGIATGRVTVTPADGCVTDVPGSGFNMVNDDLGDEEAGWYLVIFSSDDCNPDTIISNSDEETGGCISGSIRSFAVWDVMEDSG